MPNSQKRFRNHEVNHGIQHFDVSACNCFRRRKKPKQNAALGRSKIMVAACFSAATARTRFRRGVEFMK